MSNLSDDHKYIYIKPAVHNPYLKIQIAVQTDFLKITGMDQSGRSGAAPAGHMSEWFR